MTVMVFVSQCFLNRLICTLWNVQEDRFLFG